MLMLERLFSSFLVRNAERSSTYRTRNESAHFK